MGTKHRLRLSGKNKQVFLDGLKRYQERGVRILIDGREATEEQWERILEVYRDGSFYMGDYILEDGAPGDAAPGNAISGEPAPENAVSGKPAPGNAAAGAGPAPGCVDLVREERVEYLRGEPGVHRLTEIHFDRVYHR